MGQDATLAWAGPVLGLCRAQPSGRVPRRHAVEAANACWGYPVPVPEDEVVRVTLQDKDGTVLFEG